MTIRNTPRTPRGRRPGRHDRFEVRRARRHEAAAAAESSSGTPRPSLPNRRELRRAELLDAAAEAIRRHGPTVSMEQMATAAGVTKPILYRHVGGREELVRALSDRFVGELTAALQEASHRAVTWRPATCSSPPSTPTSASSNTIRSCTGSWPTGC